MATAVSGWMRIGQREAAGRRDAGAFDRLFLEEYARVVSIAYRVLGDAEQAEDVAQEVFCSFYRAHSPDAPYARAWLRQAAAHMALNEIRGRKRRLRRETAEATGRERLDEGAQLALDPLHAVERAEQRREVRAALARLPEKSAAALALRYSGLSYAEVAEALGVKVEGVGTLLRRAETALRKEMRDDR